MLMATHVNNEFSANERTWHAVTLDYVHYRQGMEEWVLVRDLWSRQETCRSEGYM
jgi:hypothetical protein